MFRTAPIQLFRNSPMGSVNSIHSKSLLSPVASASSTSKLNVKLTSTLNSSPSSTSQILPQNAQRSLTYHTVRNPCSAVQVGSTFNALYNGNTSFKNNMSSIQSSLSYENLGLPKESLTKARQNKSYSISEKKREKGRYLHQDLISLGVHLGHDKKFESIAARPYILGYRHDFSIFDVRHTMWSLKRSLNFLRQASFRNCRSLFFHSGLYKMDPAFKVFFMHLAQKEKQMLIDSKWQPGIFTNFHHSCHGLLKQFAREYVRSNAIRRMTMLELFMRVLHFTQSQYLDVIGWRQHQKNMSKFWRFFCFFKTYQYLNSVPDVVVLLNPGNQYTILQELKRFHIPIVGVVDSNSFYSGISYPIWGNDDSPMFALFLFQLYMNAYKLGRYDRYKLLMEKSPRGFFDEKKGRPDVLLPLNYVQRKKHAQMTDKATGRARVH